MSSNTIYSNQLDTHSCGYFVCLHAFNASVLSSTYLSKVTWPINFHELMDNSLSLKKLIQHFRNKLYEFCSIIKHNHMTVFLKMVLSCHQLHIRINQLVT